MPTTGEPQLFRKQFALQQKRAFLSTIASTICLSGQIKRVELDSVKKTRVFNALSRDICTVSRDTKLLSEREQQQQNKLWKISTLSLIVH